MIAVPASHHPRAIIGVLLGGSGRPLGRQVIQRRVAALLRPAAMDPQRVCGVPTGTAHRS
ncbi:hypothetical protein O4H66_14630 [Comamonadaceae bacterium G21597-S1]|nr:hypothetical protein [Comamonadaceae bacterium G21597-S1]